MSTKFNWKAVYVFHSFFSRPLLCPEIPTKHTQLDKHASGKNPTLSPFRRHSHVSLRVYRTLTR